MRNNPRITKKEHNLIKGALRRVFSRSELRRQVIEESVIQGYSDPSRPRVKTWCRCAACQQPTPKSYVVADHIMPVVPVTVSFESMSLDEVVDRLWCERANLQPICPDCHKVKTKTENKVRRQNKRAAA